MTMFVMTKEQKFRYLCKPHYKRHNGRWRAYFNRYACSLYLRGRAPQLTAVLTNFPEDVVDYRFHLIRKQRFIP